MEKPIPIEIMQALGDIRLRLRADNRMNATVAIGDRCVKTHARGSGILLLEGGRLYTGVAIEEWCIVVLPANYLEAPLPDLPPVGVLPGQVVRVQAGELTVWAWNPTSDTSILEIENGSWLISRSLMCVITPRE